MEQMENEVHSNNECHILCCNCGVSIEPNAANMCVPCIRTKVDITEGIPKQIVIYFCRNCERYLQTPSNWIKCELGSKELLSLCLNKVNKFSQVRLIDACFLWTEPHSRRIKVKLIVQKEVMNGAILQQTFIIEYTVNNQMCNDCHRLEAKDFWNSVVQVRLKGQDKGTISHLEQLLLKSKVQNSWLNVKSRSEGIDFYFDRNDDVRKFLDFLKSTVPYRLNTSQRLISHDVHSNVYNYKHTFSFEIVPICKNAVVCLPPRLAQSIGSISQICVCYRVSTVLHLIDPLTLQIAEVNSQQYWRYPFQGLCSIKQYAEYIVMQNDHIIQDWKKSKAAQNHLSEKHVLSDVWVIKPSEIGLVEPIHCKTHLGHLLKSGDTVLGLDLANINVNDVNFEKLKSNGEIPDVILVKKIYAGKKIETDDDDSNMAEDDSNMAEDDSNMTEDDSNMADDDDARFQMF